MYETILHIDGMACAMCESHVNDAVRRVVDAKKVKSSHKKGETVVLTDAPVDESALSAAINSTGYRVLSVSSRPYEKKGLFGR